MVLLNTLLLSNHLILIYKKSKWFYLTVFSEVIKTPVYVLLVNPINYFNTGHYEKSSVIEFIAENSHLYVV